MNGDTYHQAIERNAAVVADAVRTSPEVVVPSCPEWTVTDLARHVGHTYRWVTEQLMRKMSTQLDFHSVSAPPEGADRAGWLTGATSTLLNALAASRDDDPAGGWRHRSVTAKFWRRRLAHETVVHRVDADDALARQPALDAELAADGIDELFENYLPYASRSDDLTGPLNLVAADGTIWRVRSASTDLVWRREPELGPEYDPGVTVTAPATTLLLVCWGRRKPSPEQVTGDVDLLNRWLGCFRW